MANQPQPTLWQVRKNLRRPPTAAEFMQRSPSPIIEMPMSPPALSSNPLSPRLSITECSPLSPNSVVREIPIQFDDEVISWIFIELFFFLRRDLLFFIFIYFSESTKCRK
jgi:hypothetical protein